MEEKDFEARLIKLTHDIDQLDAKIEDEISSLRAELLKEIQRVYLAVVRDLSIAWLRPLSSEARKRAFKEIKKLASEHLEIADKVSADDFGQRLEKFKDEINRISRAAGVGEIWGDT